MSCFSVDTKKLSKKVGAPRYSYRCALLYSGSEYCSLSSVPIRSRHISRKGFKDKEFRTQEYIMVNGEKSKNGADELRRRAEEKIGDLTSPEDLSLEDTQRLVHELKVHQIELEMQNGALRQVQIELMEAYEKYIDLYDFAPVGYLSLDESGAILEANLTLAKHLGVERAFLIGLLFVNFVAPSEKQAFRAHLAQIFKAGQPQTLETRLVNKKREVSFMSHSRACSSKALRAKSRVEYRLPIFQAARGLRKQPKSIWKESSEVIANCRILLSLLHTTCRSRLEKSRPSAVW